MSCISNFISKQIKELVSKQGLDVVATTSKVLLNIQQLKLKSIQRLSLSISETLLEKSNIPWGGGHTSYLSPAPLAVPVSNFHAGVKKVLN